MCFPHIGYVEESTAVEHQQRKGSPRVLLGCFHPTRNHQAKEFGWKFVWSKGPMAFWKLHLIYTGVITLPFRNGCRRLRLWSDEAPTTQMSESLCQNRMEKGRSQVTHSVGLGSAGRTHAREQMTFCKVLSTSGTAPLLQVRHLCWP